MIRDGFPNPIADYVAIVVRGPVRYTNPRFVTVLDSISATLARQAYISQVVSVRTIGESSPTARVWMEGQDRYLHAVSQDDV